MKSENIEWPPDIKSETTDYSPDTSPSPSKRLKTLASDSPSTSSKGKSKIVQEDDDDSSPHQQLDTCGVCLLEEGMSLRGFIDSCEHYFCFVCIMEWAKVESRCPICKRRFSAIRRPPKDGVFLSERIVNVPVRDQIYKYNGNATIGPPDPYSQVKCSMCSSSSDEHLLLLCDLCDSAAHSYCVGLGATVPEGDWFCKDCTLSRDEHDKVETDTSSKSDNGNVSALSSNLGQFTRSDVSILDIVRDGYSTREPDTAVVPTSVKQSESGLERLDTQSTVERSNAPNARTLQRCLKVHSRIRVLRENWDGFRGGSLSFSSSFEDGCKASQSQSTSLNDGSSSQNHPYDINRAWKMMDIAAKALGKKSGSKNSVPKDPGFHKKEERLLNEVSKVRPNSKYFGGLKKNESELSSCRKIIAPAQVKNNRYNCQNVSTSSNVVGSSDQSSPIATHTRCTEKVINATLGTNEKIFSRKITTSAQVKSNCYNYQNLSTASNVVGSSYQSSPIAADKHSAKKVIKATVEKENISSRKIIASAQVKSSCYNCQNLSTASNGVGSSDQSSLIAADKCCAQRMIEATVEKEKISSRKIIASAQAKSNCYKCQNLSKTSNVVGSSDQSSPIATEKGYAEKVIEATLEKKEKINEGTQSDGNIKEIEDAKSEIQSLVKINLKLLSKHKKLEVDVFKEVARHATHSIMSACGIQPPKARFRSFERVVCDHSQTRKRPSSTLMPSSCRECFFNFVKDVVSTIAFDRTPSTKE